MVKQRSETGPKGEKVGQRRSSTLRILSGGLFLHQHHLRGSLANVPVARHSQLAWGGQRLESLPWRLDIV